VSTTQVYTHVLNQNRLGVRSPLDAAGGWPGPAPAQPGAAQPALPRAAADALADAVDAHGGKGAGDDGEVGDGEPSGGSSRVSDGVIPYRSAETASTLRAPRLGCPSVAPSPSIPLPIRTVPEPQLLPATGSERLNDLFRMPLASVLAAAARHAAVGMPAFGDVTDHSYRDLVDRPGYVDRLAEPTFARRAGRVRPRTGDAARRRVATCQA
jgi:hypothetical protein